MRIVPYARVSTDEQTNDNQIWQLQKYMQEHPEHTYYPIIKETESTRNIRPEKEAIMHSLRSGTVDGILIVELSRWGRNAKELVNNIDEFGKNNWQLISLKENIDLKTVQGRFVAHIFASLYSLERDIISDRSKSGIQRSRLDGKIPGRHPDGCGCGKTGKNGQVHDGPVKPLFSDVDGVQQIVAWKYRECVLSVNAFRTMTKDNINKFYGAPEEGEGG